MKISEAVSNDDAGHEEFDCDDENMFEWIFGLWWLSIFKTIQQRYDKVVKISTTSLTLFSTAENCKCEIGPLFFLLSVYFSFEHSVNISSDFEHPLKFYGIFVKWY